MLINVNNITSHCIAYQIILNNDLHNITKCGSKRDEPIVTNQAWIFLFIQRHNRCALPFNVYNRKSIK